MSGHSIYGLPAWARQMIQDLEVQVAQKDAEIARLSAGPEDSDTFADPFGDSPVPLGRRAMVRFGGRSSVDDCFDVEMRGTDLYVLVNGTTTETAIIPQSNNTTRVRKLPRARGRG